MKRVAKDETILGIPPVVRLRPVVVEPRLTVLVPIDLEDVRVAVGIGVSVRSAVCVHCGSSTLSRCIVSGIVMP